jgi:hypothetical protein
MVVWTDPRQIKIGRGCGAYHLGLVRLDITETIILRLINTYFMSNNGVVTFLFLFSKFRAKIPIGWIWFPVTPRLRCHKLILILLIRSDLI